MSGHGIPHHADNRDQKTVGIFISVLAVVMAVIAAGTHQQSNELIVKEVKASNGFAWYQSKRQRTYANDLELKRITIQLAGTPTDAQRKLLEAEQASLVAKNAEYEAENKTILATAEADRLAGVVAGHRHHWFEYAEICLNVAMVLCSLVLLTNQKLFFHLGLAATVFGIVTAGFAHLGEHRHHEALGAEAPHSATAPPSKH